MTGRNTNIYFQEATYNRLRQITGGKISKFVNEAVEEKLQKTEQAQQKDFQKKLIAGYKKVAQNQKIQQEMAVWDETISDLWKKEDER